ncbi:MAG: ATP-binding cassette domain-containing protein [Bacteroidales bacterium]|nr:ATP-binding cassette domain-containing protein [Bacteroidales bacterium]
MRRFILKQIIFPLSGKWLKGISLLLFWTVSFIALPAISGWFLASCSLAFITANALFSYLVPSSIIRFLAITRTLTRYFERFENHKTTLEAKHNLQLKIFRSVARLPYFKKQVNNNSSILENSTYGIDLILNHLLLWILPFSTLMIALGIYFFFLKFFSTVIALEFLISSAILLFLIPQYFLARNRKLYAKLKIEREQNTQSLIQSFRGRIEITKYKLADKAVNKEEKSMLEIERLEHKLQKNSFSLQMIVGLSFSSIAIFITWHASNYGINAALAIGIFFGIMAQAELSEILFAGKSEKSSVTHQFKDVASIIQNGEQHDVKDGIKSSFDSLSLKNLQPKIPETAISFSKISLDINKGDWVAIYGETGKGKTTLLNSLFYPEYKHSGSVLWNGKTEIPGLPVPACIYVSQKAYLLTGTLRENFVEYNEQDIEKVLKIVDLTDWYQVLPYGLDTWIGENGETLSGGQRKKLLLAQALLKNPQLLVVDEPTAGISTENAIAIFQNIKHQYPDITILMCTHLKDFESVTDKIVNM